MIQRNDLLEVVLRHDADAVSALMYIVHVLTCAVEILEGHGEVRCDVTEGVAEDIFTALVLIVRKGSVVTLQVNIRVATRYPAHTWDDVNLSSGLPAPHLRHLKFGRILRIVGEVVRCACQVLNVASDTATINTIHVEVYPATKVDMTAKLCTPANLCGVLTCCVVVKVHVADNT